MPTITADPAAAIVFKIAFHSPHVVAYRLWYKRPGDAQFTIFATGTDNEASNPSKHGHTVGPLPAGSEIAYLIWLSGNGNTPYRVDVDMLQQNQALPGGFFVLQGHSDANGFAQENGTIKLA